MYLHFSDWSHLKNSLDEKGIPHGNKIIKIYAGENDPRVILKRQNLFTIESDGKPFRPNEIFHYENRKSYTGSELEEKLNSLGLDEVAKPRLRALFRFSNLPEIQSTQDMMATKNPDGSWKYNDPFEDIDGIELALRVPQRRTTLHADIFYESTLQRLKDFFAKNSFNIEDPESFVSYNKELIGLLNKENKKPIEGSPNKPEGN
ncbi:MAG: hypothetical protein WCV81_04155 [Microgenomates group bacterium]|jgi:hypothetical protein